MPWRTHPDRATPSGPRPSPAALAARSVDPEWEAVFRSPGYLLVVGAAGVLICAAVQFPPVARWVGVGCGPLSVAAATYFVVACLNTLSYRRFGPDSLPNLVFDALENCASIFAVLLLAYHAERWQGVYWGLYYLSAALFAAQRWRSWVSGIALVLGPVLLALVYLSRGASEPAGDALLASGVGVALFQVVAGTARRLEEAMLARRRLETELEVVEREKAAERERERLTRELHDGIGAELAAVLMRGEQLAQRAAEGSPMREEATRLTSQMRRALGELRLLVRGRRNVPVPWEEMIGLIRASCEAMVTPGIAFSFEVRGPKPLERIRGEVAMHLVRIAQEGVRNAVCHGPAANVRLTIETDLRLRLAVEDDGPGLPPQVLQASGGGLRSLQQRADLLAATFSVESRPGRTRLELVVPVVNALRPIE